MHCFVLFFLLKIERGVCQSFIEKRYHIQDKSILKPDDKLVKFLMNLQQKYEKYLEESKKPDKGVYSEKTKLIFWKEISLEIKKIYQKNLKKLKLYNQFGDGLLEIINSANCMLSSSIREQFYMKIVVKKERKQKHCRMALIFYRKFLEKIDEMFFYRGIPTPKLWFLPKNIDYLNNSTCVSEENGNISDKNKNNIFDLNRPNHGFQGQLVIHSSQSDDLLGLFSRDNNFTGFDTNFVNEIDGQIMTESYDGLSYNKQNLTIFKNVSDFFDPINTNNRGQNMIFDNRAMNLQNTITISIELGLILISSIIMFICTRFYKRRR